jgi:hypothetical protein
MADSMAQFELDLKRLVSELKSNADLVVRRIIFGVAERIDMRSPVGNPELWKNAAPKGYVGGHFRANWQLGVNRVPEGEIVGEDKDGKKTQEAIKSSVPTPSYGPPVYYLVNNVPYAIRLEEGWSKQAPPQGIVQLTVIEYQNVVREAIRSLPK